ncbi:mechanosensitive ion channel protein MscS [bacterium (Candidatus Blackallbacteria) CG17_big_fil_post_rev_8_21_14_2_50_48_46]|uniref:Mechanosensitive ion channel protein MscS n=1 Tax=bacterium (Candidatus Blackallbacteria) CG17_big_fil_post_rev_8_21_14_2_50_48_46 TaxID=2014261 RepID=A0A2M7G328_9BACT|nr:MAG: mechanosensitive ion channel protein MscS [bacterium (Candidatus Blackallbacteria) CG18_big_fil_WC_8_21_14_2_50_49_26]PIW16228.1 MAG: mechanosensitive ion channel protein MscS [bacterium (Candidatus Blackallbacteria) CG17_big_fil_post_rev_8_21_14_2_50_48_46]PIW49889.1 MAG: mechanosensitive ion channel protein MscS [bacterium (Candidatus Blackallbacteria) CG13_big_fil_rev_8_21_14_2_50_49_14]
MEPYLKKFNEMAMGYGARFFGALLILAIGLWLSKRLANLLKDLLSKTQLEPTFISFSGNMLRVVLTVVVALAAVNSLGVPMTSVLALLGTIGLAVALALKDSLNNVAAGISLLILRPFKVGEYVEVGGVGGSVVEINLFHTLLNTADNRWIAMPNAKLLGDTIVNFSRNTNRRIDLLVNVSYRADLKRTKEVLWELIEADSRILKEPIPVVGVADLANSSVDLVVRPWVPTSEYWNVRFDLTQAIKERFDQEGIEIPFPQRDVHLYQYQA